MTLDEAVKEFESDFSKVVEFDADQERADCAPGGNNRYVVICSSGPKREAEKAEAFLSVDEAVSKWLEAVRAQHKWAPCPVLFWRIRPQITSSRTGKRHFVYSRLTFGNQMQKAA